MKISNFFMRVKSAVYTQYSISKYRHCLAQMTDDEVETVVARERVCRGWSSQRSYFLAALRLECKSRGLAYCWV